VADPTQNPFQVQTGRGSWAVNAGQMVARKRQREEQQLVSGIANEELEALLGEAGDSVDINRTMGQAQLNAAKRLSALGKHQQAQQLYSSGAAMLNAGTRQNADIDKLYSEVDENLASAESSRAPKDEFVRLQNEREALLEHYRTVDGTTEAGKSVQRRIDELSQRLQYMSTHHTQYAPPDATKPTTPVQTDLQRAWLNADARLIRLREMQANFKPETMGALSKAKVGATWVADKLNLADPNDKAALADWVNFSQSAANDMNAVIRELAGAAVTTGEAERQLRVLVNPGSLGNPFSGDSPEEARVKLDNNLRWVDAAQKRYADLLQRGLLEANKPLDAEAEALLARFPIENYMPPAVGPAASAPRRVRVDLYGNEVQ